MLTEELKKNLTEGVVTVRFNKANGELREMRCTTNQLMVPTQPLSESPETETKERKVNPDVQVVWDLDKEAWRSFRLDSLVEVLL
jgi:hypothetical protein